VAPPDSQSSQGPSWRWVAASAADLRWCSWDGACAVYHRPSGKTHFVNDATRRLLEDVLALPLPTADVAGQLARAQGVAETEEFRAHVWGLLVRLEELALIERA
jgi:PqqD family protein of HPr-rel-A system